MLLKTALCTLLFLCFNNLSSASDLWGGSFSKLNDRVIRSLASAKFDSNLLIVGNKGGNAGDATVFISRDGGVSWRFLNSNNPLHKSATDVQAVLPITPQVMLAGTWKHGLFRSADGGVTFNQVTEFPSKDVRGFALQGSVLFAATGDRGIVASPDEGQSWRSTTLDAGYFWSVRTSADESALLASSPEKGLYRSLDQGRTWQQLLVEKKIYEASQSSTGVIAAAGETGLLLSSDNGESWRSPEALNKQRLSSVQFRRDSKDSLLLGGWESGLWEYSIGNDTSRRHATTLPVLHLEEIAGGVATGTWGKGLHVYPATTSTSYLIEATKAKDNAVVDHLLEAGADPNAHDALRNTALIFASRDGLLQIAESLINRGADVSWIDDEGATPLILASHKNHPAVVKLLLANNADKNSIDKFGRTALDYAERRSSSDEIAKLLKAK